MGHIYSSTSAGVVSSNLVDVVKVDVAWQQSELYISNGGGRAGDPERYEKFGKWMERKEPIQIASLGLFDEVIEFNDGRHRFAWLRDHGVKIMTVHVDPDKVELVKSRFEALAGLISSLGEAGNLLTRNGRGCVKTHEKIFMGDFYSTLQSNNGNFISMHSTLLHN